MNSKLRKIFIDYKVERYYSEIMNGVSTNLQEAMADEIVFYNFNSENDKDIELFESRIQKSKSKTIFVNTQKTQSDSRVIYLSKDQFESLKKELVDYFYPLADKMPVMLGVTGTNGKTTTVQLITNILWQNGYTAISVGTVGVCGPDGQVLMPLNMTTPGLETIRKILCMYQDKDFIAFEVSSHALEQERLKYLNFAVVGWTSFSQDHLDYHQTMDKYFESKKKIISLTDMKQVILPSSQTEIAKKLRVHEYIFSNKIDIEVFEGLPESLKIDFNIDNLELAIEIVNQATRSKCAINPKKLRMPEGRIDAIKRKDGFIYIDYAHTPDALLRVLVGIRKIFSDKPLWLVFGCGGNRDKAKRPLMGDVANLYADEYYVTSDNPRDEDPQTIINEILITGKRGRPVVDRKRAIEEAIKSAPSNAIILVAGKGHEKYQEVKGVKKYFCDKEVVLTILDEKNVD